MLSELYKSQSANVNAVIDADKIRIKQYVSAMRTLLGYIAAKPDLDLPETNPMKFPLRAEVPEQDIENEPLSHLCRLIRVGMRELVASQSSRFSSGMFDPDRVRYLGVIAKIEKHVEQFINLELPLDFVESSPRAPINGPGLGGIGAGSNN